MPLSDKDLKDLAQSRAMRWRGLYWWVMGLCWGMLFSFLGLAVLAIAGKIGDKTFDAVMYSLCGCVVIALIALLILAARRKKKELAELRKEFKVE